MQKMHKMVKATSLSGIAKTCQENLTNEYLPQFFNNKKTFENKAGRKNLNYHYFLLFLINHIGKSLEFKVQDCLTPVKR